MRMSYCKKAALLFPSVFFFRMCVCGYTLEWNFTVFTAWLLRLMFNVVQCFKAGSVATNSLGKTLWKFLCLVWMENLIFITLLYVKKLSILMSASSVRGQTVGDRQMTELSVLVPGWEQNDEHAAQHGPRWAERDESMLSRMVVQAWACSAAEAAQAQQEWGNVQLHHINTFHTCWFCR